MGDGVDRRKLGLFDATMLVMGGIVGVGIFFTPAEIAGHLPHSASFFGMWVAGALVALCGAATFAELGGTFPRYGGWFEFLREIYGPFVSFLFAWVILGVVATGAIAVIASFGAREFLGLFGEVEPLAHVAVAAGIVTLLTVLTALGIKVGATFQNVCMVAKLTAIAALIVGGLVLFMPAQATATAPAVTTPFTWKGAFSASLLVLFAFGGWQHLCYIADAVRDPQRIIPKALLFGVLGVGAIYLLVNLAFVRVLGLEGLAATSDFAATAAGQVFGTNGARALRAAMAVSAVGVCAVNIIVNPAIFVAMARSGLFFKGFARLHRRTGAPILALSTQLLLSLAYLLWAHSEDLFGLGSAVMNVDVLTKSVVFAEWFFHGLMAWGLIRLRARRPDLPRPYRSFAYPLAPALYLVAALFVLGGNLSLSPGVQTGVGLAVIALGALIYRPWRGLITRSR